jgi:subtilisin
MDDSELLQLWNQSIKARQHRDKQFILRFKDRGEYEHCVLQLSEWSKANPGLSSIMRLKIIHALSLPQSTVPSWCKHSKRYTIEEDSIIHVHAPIGLAPRKSSTPGSEHIRIPWGVRHIRAPDIWSRSTGKRVKIGVVDTGIDYYHPDLRGRISRGINLIHRSMLPHDDNGHGTHIAGTIAASNGQNGMLGVSPGALIYPIKAFDHNGTAYVSDIIAGIDWCVRNRMNIINMSFGMRQYSSALHDAVRRAHQAGIVIVASSGNDGKRTMVDYPARLPQTISVGAITRSNAVAAFSNKGKDIDIYAPGDKIHSTWLSGKYNELSGTSMATSHVSGTIALLLESKPSLTPNELKTILKDSASPVRNTRTRSVIKRGLNALKALRCLPK